MAKKEKQLDDLFEDTLKDIYYAENKILKALPKMAKAAHSGELKAAFWWRIRCFSSSLNTNASSSSK